MINTIICAVLYRSIVGIYIIGIVLIARLFLSKCSRKYTFYLWFIVFINLCVPVNIGTGFSLMPRVVSNFSIENQLSNDSLEPSGNQPQTDSKGAGTTGNTGLSQEESVFLNKNTLRSDTDMRWLPITLFIVWLCGFTLLILYYLITARSLQKTILAGEITQRDDMRQTVVCKSLSTPFLWGIIHPTIVLPANLEQQETEYILAHEECHRQRKDHLSKTAAFFITALHWFNPFVWIAYTLFCKDMEMACDEAVLANANTDIKKAYAESLLRYAARQNGFLPTSLMFAESSVKSRIKNVLHFHKKEQSLLLLQ